MEESVTRRSILGAGPFQQGTIYEGLQFAGAKIEIPLKGSQTEIEDGKMVAYDREHSFIKPEKQSPVPAVKFANFEEMTSDDAKAADKNGRTDKKQPSQKPAK